MISINEMLAANKKAEAERAGAPAKAYARSSYLDSLQIADGGTIPALSGIPFYHADHLPKGVLCLLMNADGKPVGMIVDNTYERQTAHSDNGGSVEAMQALNEARDRLRGGA